MNLRSLAVMPMIMLLLWTMAAMFIFSFSIRGDQTLYDGVMEKIKEDVRSLPFFLYDFMPSASPLPTSQDHSEEEGTSLDVLLSQKPLEPVPDIWKMQDLEFIENTDNFFNAGLTYYGGDLTSTITYQTDPSIWIVDLPGDWANELKNDYRFSEGLIRRLALGLHRDYLRLVLYLREPHGGREVIPKITILDSHTFSLTLGGAFPEVEANP